ncbi:unnamed protein product [Rotaria socialis]|uniref:Protein phosphatase n=1 Tax=Rotaria socialis TaxID=392032 RepID=A0A817QW40_9BILA|nr:unnamed protein product [Rotaria socialis]
MAQEKGLNALQYATFADDYDVYVDYGRGGPIRMRNNEQVFIDVEKFLTEQTRLPKSINNIKSYGYLSTNVFNKHGTMIKNNDPYDSRKTYDDTLSSDISSYSNYRQYDEENKNRKSNPSHVTVFTPDRSYRYSSRIEQKIVYNENWLSKNEHNIRVAAFIDRLHEKCITNYTQVSNECKSSRCNKLPVDENNHRKASVDKTERNLSLRIAVNGASKSWQGKSPLLNSNLTNGDFGDDAGMAVENKNFCFVGLADGAGGNRSYGINPADFSRAILSACENIINRNNFKPDQLPRLIKSAMEQVEATDVQGSSTLCLLALDKQERTLTSLNIGDSGFVIFRDNELYSQSTCTMNSNGCVPRQLFALNGPIRLPCFLNESQILKDGSLETVKVRQGDIIILSSDGLWDVIKSEQLKQIIERTKNKNLQQLADDLLQHAVNGIFSTMFLIQYNTSCDFLGYMANSRDDILVIVCRVDES